MAEICGTTPGRARVAQEHLGVSGERDDALLDARAARVVQADDRRAVLHREVHDLADLVGVGLRERAAEDREVLREDVDRPAVDRARSAHDAVSGDLRPLDPEVAAAVDDERVELEEGAAVEQQVDALVRRELSLGVLALDPLGASSLEARLAKGLEILDPLFERHSDR